LRRILDPGWRRSRTEAMWRGVGKCCKLPVCTDLDRRVQSCTLIRPFCQLHFSASKSCQTAHLIGLFSVPDILRRLTARIAASALAWLATKTSRAAVWTSASTSAGATLRRKRLLWGLLSRCHCAYRCHCAAATRRPSKHRSRTICPCLIHFCTIRPRFDRALYEFAQSR